MRSPVIAVPIDPNSYGTPSASTWRVLVSANPTIRGQSRLHAWRE